MIFKFSRMRRNDVPLVMRWRSSPHVTKYMNNDIFPELQNQLRWYESRPHDYYWMVKFEDKPIGVINLADIATKHRRASFGFYIGELDYCYLGGFVTPYFYNHVFKTFEIDRLYADVFTRNSSVIAIHETHGFRIAGHYKDHIHKADGIYSVHVMVLEKSEWANKKRFHAMTADFE